MENTSNLRLSVAEFAKTLDLPPFVHELNDLLNQRAWEQAAEQETIAMQKIADMWAIVREVATVWTTYYEETEAHRECVFCNGLADKQERDGVKHEPDCPAMKARALVAAIEQGVQP